MEDVIHVIWWALVGFFIVSAGDMWKKFRAGPNKKSLASKEKGQPRKEVYDLEEILKK